MKKNKSTTIKSLLRDIKTIVMVVKYYGLNPEPVKCKSSKEKYKSLSPFKEETNASFKIYPREKYKAAYGFCYATETRANAIDIIKAKENCSTDDAYNKLREILGIPQPSTYTIDLNFKFATRLVHIIRDRNASNHFNKAMFNTFVGLYNQYDQSYELNDRKVQKSIKNTILKEEVDGYASKKLDIPLIDFYSFILLAEKKEIIRIDPYLKAKAEAELVAENGEIIKSTESLEINKSNPLVSTAESYSFSYILEGRYEQPDFSNPYMLKVNNYTGEIKLNRIDTSRKFTITPHSDYSSDLLSFNTKPINIWKKSENTFLDSFSVFFIQGSVITNNNIERKINAHYIEAQENHVAFPTSKLLEKILPENLQFFIDVRIGKKILNEVIERGILRQMKDRGLLVVLKSDENCEALVYQKYYPLKLKENRYRNSNGISKHVLGLDILKERNTLNDICFISKSFKDWLVHLTMEHDAIAVLSENQSLSEDAMSFISSRYSKCYILYDHDKAGMGNAYKRVKELNAFYTKRGRNCTKYSAGAIFFPEDGKGKDVSDRIHNMVRAGMEGEEAVKTVKNEIEQLIANENSGLLGVEKEKEVEPIIIENTADATQGLITRKDGIIKSSSKRSRLISSINDECTQEYSKEFLDGLCISKEDLKQLDIWEHKKTKCAILILDVLQTFDTNKRKHDISYVYHAYNWQYTNSKISDSPGAKDYLFLMHLLYEKFPRTDELIADKPLVIADSVEKTIRIYRNCPDYYVVGVIDKNFHFGEEQMHYKYYTTNKFSSVTVLDMPSLAEELNEFANEFAKEERIMPFKARIDTFEEFMKLEVKKTSKKAVLTYA
ncbi:MAG: hypothetical protein Pg6B_08850 [Candidatus Azobacteroides pseudotrichonymphae]|nr:MAG: hypothetical protein Pg6B_08850 [Candidatus Azobacteroides pseudotrichonymphae]